MDISVVIPVHNAERFIHPLLESLADQEWEGDWEVVIADNGSSDRGVAIAESYRSRLPALQIVDASDRAGGAYARNVGAQAAAGSGLVFVDHDDVVGSGYVASMAAALRTHDFVCGRWEVDRLNPDWITSWWTSGQSDGPMMFTYEFLPYAAGGTLGVSRSLFEALGGFDSSMEYVDCLDLCWRAQLEQGAELVFVPDAVLHYRYRQTLRELFRQGRKWGRAQVDVYKRYRSRGLGRIPPRESLRRWKQMVLDFRALNTRAGRARWVADLGNRIGRIEGSVANRTLML
jgi:GT2 family glycosyltransferase